MVGLLRSERTGRLIENQDLGSAKQRLEYLHALLQTHGQLAHPRIGGHFQSVVLGELREHPARPRLSGREQRALHRPEDHVLDHGEGIHQHEMLVNHADAGGDGVLAVFDEHRPPRDPDLPLVGPIEAVQDAHQGGLAGAVLADDAVNAATPDGEAHAPVRVHASEVLFDAEKLDRRRAAPGPLRPRRHSGRICGYFAGHSPSVT